MTNEKQACSSAIVLAGGSGRRMQSSIPKQYLELGGYPLLYYSLKCFQECGFIRDIVLVTGADEQDYCRSRIVEKYGFSKVRRLAEGGRERYDSVYAGLCALKQDPPSYVFIHDSARPFVDQEMLERGLQGVQQHGACSLGMPSKDTVNLTDEAGRVLTTPDRSRVWIVQTPQIFHYEKILRAHEKLREAASLSDVTDDVMVYSRAFERPVYMVPGSYRNIKITTPEDLPLGEGLLNGKHPLT